MLRIFEYDKIRWFPLLCDRGVPIQSEWHWLLSEQRANYDEELMGFVPADHHDDAYVWSVLEVESFGVVMADPSNVDIDGDIFADVNATAAWSIGGEVST